MNGGTTTSSVPWGFRARLVKVHDGDSVFVECDLGFSARHEAEIRLDAVHAPELVQAGGIETREYVSGWMAAHAAHNRTWPFWIEVVMTTTYEPEMRQSFTRYVGTVWPFDQRNQSVLSLNYSVTVFLSGHPEWPAGD